MKNKTLSFVIASVFALVFLMSAVSAVSLTDITLVSSPENVSNDAGSFDIVFTLTNEDTAGDLYYNLSEFTSSQTGLAFSFDDSYIAEGNSTDPTTETITATISFDSGQTGTITGNINVGDAVDAINKTLPFSVSLIEPESDEPEEITACSLIGDGSLNVNIKDVKVLSPKDNGLPSYGDDDEWLPLDEVEVEIEIENKNDDEKIKDIKVEWGLWSEETDEWVIELDDLKEFDIKKDSEETKIISFKINKKGLDVDLDELEDGDYTLYVIAHGEEQVDPTEDVCSIDSEAVSIVIESDFVILDDIEIADVVQCGAEVQVSADVWNIGDSDQDEVKVLISNSQLGISELIEVGDIDAFDSNSLNVILQLPDKVDEKTYYLDFKVYDEDNDQYENDFDDDESFASVPLKVEGSCAVAAEASVSAVLEEGGQAGKPLTVKATIINTGDEQTTYMLNAASYAEWAESAQLDQSTVVLNSGESKEVLITFNVNSDALGDYLFNIEVLSDNELIVNQPVQVSIEKKAGFSITGNAIGSKSYLWGIGILNVILIIIIIIVAIRIARK